MPVPVALTVAGSDPSGGAGIQADLKTFHQHGVYGASALTLITVQNTRSVDRVEVLDRALVKAQVEAVWSDLPPNAVKTGALGSAAVVEVVAAAIARVRTDACPLVVDPVMISKHGTALLDEAARAALVTSLLPEATLVTPNAHEAEALVGAPVRTVADAREAAVAIAGLGPRAVLVKGGHLTGEREAVDVLYVDGAFELFRSPRIATKHTHGTGCTYSSAITARLAKGADLFAAVGGAKRWLTEALRTAPGLGGGVGPVNHQAPTSH